MSVLTYKCKNCGAPLNFNAATQSFKCEFCLSDFTEEEIKSHKEKINEMADSEPNDPSTNNHEFENKGRVYNCSSCGAEILTDDTTSATFCYYCHSPAIIPGQLSGKYKPAKVIPFQLDKKAATEIFIKWCKKKPLLSKTFTTESQLKLISGVYVPFWLFDCDVRGRMSGDAKIIRSWTVGDKRHTETKIFNIFRSGTVRFGSIPADGSKKADDHLMNILEPYDYNQMKDFSMSYLSGFIAEKYDVDDKEVYGRIKDRINKYTTKLFRDTINGYTSVNVRDCTVDIYNSKAAYVLLPTWMMTYNYKGKTYIFAINGQTGKIAGSLPLSKSRVLAWFSGISATVFAILCIGGFLL